MPEENYLAFDFGAQSARAIHGKLDAGQLEIAEIYRFRTGGTKVRDTLRWDVSRFFDELKIALKKVSESSSGDLQGGGVDSWGVDYALLNVDGELISPETLLEKVVF